MDLFWFLSDFTVLSLLVTKTFNPVIKTVFSTTQPLRGFIVSSNLTTLYRFDVWRFNDRLSNLPLRPDYFIALKSTKTYITIRDKIDPWKLPLSPVEGTDVSQRAKLSRISSLEKDIRRCCSML
jgi:hypothetical protein